MHLCRGFKCLKADGPRAFKYSWCQRDLVKEFNIDCDYMYCHAGYLARRPPNHF